MEEGGNTRKRVKREKNESSLENRLEFASERFCHNRHKPFVHCPGHVEYPLISGRFIQSRKKNDSIEKTFVFIFSNNMGNYGR